MTQGDSTTDAAARLFAEIFEQHRRGIPPDPNALAAEHPDLAPEILEGIAMLSEIDETLVDSAAGRVLGDFRIAAEIGRGGMGVVYEAEQVSLGRRVALKILPAASMLDGKQVLRFQHEARAAGRLDHPNIVPVYAVGEENGVHYYAMRFVEGESLRDVLMRVRRAAASPREDDSPSTPSTWPRTVAAWVLQAARALEHSHEVGILHRDIKPANLLLEADGHVSITDFGLAQSLLHGRLQLTMSGEMLGTLAYCSPEQASGRHGRVDERADIYSLGATLYELLTLQRPHSATEPAELLRCITRELPRPPRRIDPRIPIDLETITLRAIAPEPEHRYGSAGQLAGDLEAFLEGRAITARRIGWIERTLRWCRRNPGLAATSLAASVLAVVAIGVGLAAREAVRQRDRAARAEDEARLIQGLASAEAGLRDVGPNRRTQVLGHVRHAVAAMRRSSTGERAELLRRLRSVAVSALDKLDLVAQELQVPDSRYGSLADASFRTIARVRSDWQLTLEDCGSASGPWITPIRLGGSPRDLRFSPDGRWLGVRFAGKVQVVDVAGHSIQRVSTGGTRIADFDFAPEDGQLLLADEHGGLHRGPARGGPARPAGKLEGEHGAPVQSPLQVRVEPATGRIAVLTGDYTIQIHGREGRFELALRDPAKTSCCAWHPRGLLATGDFGGGLRLWDVDSGDAVAFAQGHSSLVGGIEIDRDHPWLLSRSWDRTTRLWHAEDLTPLGIVTGGSDDYVTLGAGRIGPLRESGQRRETTLRILPSVTHRAFHLGLAPATDTPRSAVHPDGEWIVHTTGTGVVFSEFGTGRVLRHLEVGRRPVAICFDERADRLFVGTYEGCFRIDLDQGLEAARAQSIFHAEKRTCVQILPDGRLLLAVRGRLMFLDPQTGRADPLEQTGADSNALYVSPSGRFAATDSWLPNGACVWDLETRRMVWRSDPVQCRVQFDAEDRLWFSDSDRVSALEPGSWAVVESFPSGSSSRPPQWVCVSSTGILATTPDHRRIELRRVEEQQPLLTLEPDPPANPQYLSFTPDGRWLLAGTQGRVNHAWNIPQIRAELRELGIGW